MEIRFAACDDTCSIQTAYAVRGVVGSRAVCYLGGVRFSAQSRRIRLTRVVTCTPFKMIACRAFRDFADATLACAGRRIAARVAVQTCGAAMRRSIFTSQSLIETDIRTATRCDAATRGT